MFGEEVAAGRRRVAAFCNCLAQGGHWRYEGCRFSEATAATATTATRHVTTPDKTHSAQPHPTTAAATTTSSKAAPAASRETSTASKSSKAWEIPRRMPAHPSGRFPPKIDL